MTQSVCLPPRRRCRRSLPALILALAALASAGAQDTDPPFLSEIADLDAFARVAVPSRAPDEERIAKFTLPARPEDPTLLGPFFQNAFRFPFHIEFLRETFPDRFGGLTETEFFALTGRRATRQYYTGTITHYSGPGSARGFGFTVFTDGSRPDELLEAAEVRAVYEALERVFTAADEFLPLQYAPLRSAEILRAATWVDPGFPIRKGGSQDLPESIPYTAALGYGRLRLFTHDELLAADARAELDWQTLVVVDEAPGDLESVVGGVVTGTPQGELSHLALRLARREAPNVFVREARARFAALDGKLARLEVTPSGYSVREATLEEAEAFWAERRPELPPLPVADETHAELEGLEELTAERTREEALAIYGAKAANLAVLYRYLGGEHQTPGFAIPFRFYLEFLRSNRVPSHAEPERVVTYEEYLGELLADPRFRSDGAYRRDHLEALREFMEDFGQIDPALLAAIRSRIQAVFGEAAPKVRFRSSSNAEDSILFNGAGLYDSTSVCLADDLDGDDQGPSRCDATKDKERTVARGLRAVWSSLWSPRAFEEREFFQIDHLSAAMGVLVTLAYPAEDANGVAFTGNPTLAGDDNFQVVVQLGDASVVQPDVGIEAEKVALARTGSGAIGRAVLLRASSLVVPGARVLSAAQLVELGETMAAVSEPFLAHFDLGGIDPARVLVDYEFKFQDGVLVIKQARPFLRGEAGGEAPVFTIHVPPETAMCGAWEEFREPDAEYYLKSRIELVPGSVTLPSASTHVARDLFSRVEFGPDRRVLEPLDHGLFRLEVETGCCPEGRLFYRWSFDQSFDLGDGEALTLVFESTFNGGPGSTPEDLEITLDEELITEGFVIRGLHGGDANFVNSIRYSSCTYELLPLWEIAVEFAGGNRATFFERYRVPFAGSGPATLVRAEAELGGQPLVEEDYWKLVYAADHHNWNEEFRMIFDPPITVGGVSGVFALHVQEGFDSIPQRAALLDRDFDELAELEVLSYAKTELVFFRRGDTNNDAAVDVADALTVLGHLFRGDPQPLDCEKSADLNDDGLLDLTDPVALLGHLFLGGPPPAPPAGECGLDVTPDGLSCFYSRLCAGE